MKDSPWRNESGLTLAEILVAVALILTGLVAVMQAFPLGTQGMETGRRQSTALFLGEQKIEQINAFSLSTAVGQGFANIPICNPCTGAAPFNQENFNSIPGYPEYSRTVIVQNGPTATTMLVRVQVSYGRVTSTGVFPGGTQADITTLVARWP